MGDYHDHDLDHDHDHDHDEEEKGGMLTLHLKLKPSLQK